MSHELDGEWTTIVTHFLCLSKKDDSAPKSVTNLGLSRQACIDSV